MATFTVPSSGTTGSFSDKTFGSRIRFNRSGRINSIAFNLASPFTGILRGAVFRVSDQQLIGSIVLVNVSNATDFLVFNNINADVEANTDYVVTFTGSTVSMRLYNFVTGSFTDGGGTMTLPGTGNVNLFESANTGSDPLYPNFNQQTSRTLSMEIVATFNNAPNQPTVEYNNAAMSTDSNNPTEIDGTAPEITIVGTDPDSGDTLSYQLEVFNTSNALIWSSGFVSSGVISVPDGNLVRGEQYRFAGTTRDQDNATSPVYNGHGRIRDLEYTIGLDQNVTVTQGQSIIKLDINALINDAASVSKVYDPENKIYTFTFNDVNSEEIVIKVTAKDGVVMNNLLFGIS